VEWNSDLHIGEHGSSYEISNGSDTASGKISTASLNLYNDPLGSNEHFDVIHAHDWMTFLAGIEAKKESGKPLITHVHATEFDRSGDSVNMEIYEIERHGMEQADKVITVSNWTREKVINYYGINPEKVEVVHNGITKDPHMSRDQAEKNLPEKIVLFLGRVTMQKGPKYFIEAAKIVLDTIDNVRFVMAGSGDMLPQMIERIAELRLQQYFHFTGFLHGHRRERMYAMSDARSRKPDNDPVFKKHCCGIPNRNTQRLFQFE